MLVLICFDVSTTTKAGRRRLRRVAEACEDHGSRVQFSIFECPIDKPTWLRLRQRLLETIDESEDSLRVYLMDDDAHGRTEHFGVRQPLDLRGPLIV